VSADKAEARPSVGRWKRAVVLWAVKLAFLAVVAAAIARDFDVAKFTAALGAMGALPFIACFAIDVLFFVIETFRLVFLSRRAYPFWLLLRSRYLASLIGTILPGLAATDLVRVFLIDRARPGNKAAVLVLLLGNRLYGLLSLVSLGIIALLQPAGESLLGHAHGWLPVSAIGVVLLTLPLWLGLGPVQRLGAAVLRRLPPWPSGIASRAWDALVAMTSVRQWSFAIVTCTATNLLVVCEFWLLSRAVHVPMSFGQWCLFVPFVAVATMLPLGIGAIGTQEAALLVASRLAGVPFEPLLLVSAGIHLVRIGGTLPGLAFSSDAILTIQHLRARYRSGAALQPPDPR
jgi:hypothetical protein